LARYGRAVPHGSLDSFSDDLRMNVHGNHWLIFRVIVRPGRQKLQEIFTRVSAFSPVSAGAGTISSKWQVWNIAPSAAEGRLPGLVILLRISTFGTLMGGRGQGELVASAEGCDIDDEGSTSTSLIAWGNFIIGRFIRWTGCAPGRVHDDDLPFGRVTIRVCIARGLGFCRWNLLNGWFAAVI
jgi:hypothetical protein